MAECAHSTRRASRHTSPEPFPRTGHEGGKVVRRLTPTHAARRLSSRGLSIFYIFNLSIVLRRNGI